MLIRKKLSWNQTWVHISEVLFISNSSQKSIVWPTLSL